MMEQTIELLVRGHVQGVGFRNFTLQMAHLHHLRGYVQNKVQGSVKIVVQGNPSNINAFITTFKSGPTRGFIESLQQYPLTSATTFQDFHVRY